MPGPRSADDHWVTVAHAASRVRLLYLSCHVSRYPDAAENRHVGIACRSLSRPVERYVSVFGLAVASEEDKRRSGGARGDAGHDSMARTYSSSSARG